MSFLADLTSWIAAGLGTDGPPVSLAGVGANFLPDTPDEIVVVSSAGGSAPVIDGAFEPCLIHIRSRSTSDVDAEELAHSVHTLFTSLTGSFTMGSTYVLYAEPTRGRPAFFERDASLRTVYIGEYELTVPA